MSPFPVYHILLWFSGHLQKSENGLDMIFSPLVGDITNYMYANFQVATFNETKVMTQQVELFEWPSYILTLVYLRPFL